MNLSRLIGLMSLVIPLSVFAEAPLLQNLESLQTDVSRAQEAEVRMAADVRFLSSDDMRGRGPGTGGLERAAEYIAERWRILGLETKLFNDSPFQEFNAPGEVQASRPERNKLRWTHRDPANAGTSASSFDQSVELKLNEDFRPMSVGANKGFDAKLAFVGYGISSRNGDWSYDDYASVDVRGKIVIMIRKEPRQADPNSPFDGTKSSRHALFGTKVANAKVHGAVGIIFVNDRLSASNALLDVDSTMVSPLKRSEDAAPDVPSPGSSEGSSSRKSTERLPGIEDAGKGLPNESIPVLFSTRREIDKLIDSVRPGLNLDEIESRIDADLRTQSFEISGWQASGEVFLEKTVQRIKNVIACIPGQGSLANETVVIGAHFDHVGMGGAGSLAPGTFEVHNGADDNASGTAALLEVARRFAVSQQKSSKPRRRLVFVGFTGEERGLLGSRHYVAHPRYAIESTIAMLNMDMVGRMAEKQLVVFGIGSAASFDRLVDDANRRVGLTIRKQIEAMGPSDHHPFFERRVPVLHFFTGLHEDYHRPSDDFSKINTVGMVAITDMVYQIGSVLAESPERPRYIAVKGRANIRIPIERKNEAQPGSP